MKKLCPLYFVLFLLTAFTGQAQDRIITCGNDTIACKVIGSNSRYLRFETEQNGVITRKKMNSRETKSILYGSNQSLPVQEQAPVLHRWRISVTGGLGYLVGDTGQGRKDAAQEGLTGQEIDDYFDQILWGWQTGANVHYFIRSDLGIGLNYRFFRTGADLLATFDPQDGVTLYHGKLIENMYINYAGPSLFSSYFISQNKKLQITGSFSAGIVFFRDETTMMESSLLMKGKTFGMTAAFGLEYFISSHLALGADFNLFASKIGKITADNGSSSGTVKLKGDDRQNVSAIDCSAGLRIYF